MKPNANSGHPLAKDVRNRRDRMENEASVVAGIEPVRAYLNEHANHFTQEDHLKTLSLLVRNTARLGCYKGLYLCLANGGCMAEGLEIARKDEDKLFEDAHVLTSYISTAFRRGETSMGEDLARNWFERTKPLWAVDRFRIQMEVLGQTTWAEKATRLILQSELSTKINASLSPMPSCSPDTPDPPFESSPLFRRGS